MRTKPCVAAKIVIGVSYLCESKLWNCDLTRIPALDEERTRKESDVKKVLVKFSDAHD